MKKRSHKNTRRLTALERAHNVIEAWTGLPLQGWRHQDLLAHVERALQAHARAALRRNRR